MFTKKPRGARHQSIGSRSTRCLVAGGMVILGMTGVAGAVQTQAGDRSGKAIVEAACKECHGPGKDGAPRIGDTKAWSTRAAQGLGALTAHAIGGIRRMPAHGGSASVTDAEIARAITYMVNQSGGNWAEPIDKSTPVAARSGEQVVQMRCASCHQTGENGAPRIGDKAAWIPRLKHGVDSAVRSAISGHGGMPARGGMPDLTDGEMRSAVTYMFVPAGVTTAAAGSTPAAVLPANRKAVGGLEVYLGVVAADTIRRQMAADPQKQAQAAIPKGSDAYHVSVSLFDAASHAEIADAQVEATIQDPVMGGQTRKLEVMVVNGTISYGNYFRVAGSTPYRIALHIVRPGTGQMVDTDFEVKR